MTDTQPCPAVTIPPLQLSRYRLRFRERPSNASSLALYQGYLGSAWRGIFGNALRRAVCVTNLPKCNGCALTTRCTYTKIFETSLSHNSEAQAATPFSSHTTSPISPPNPYMLVPSNNEFDENSKYVTLGLTLFGRKGTHLSRILYALAQAAATGITRSRVELDLHDVQVERTAENNTFSWRTIQTAFLPQDDGHLPNYSLPPKPSTFRVHLLSPLRIKKDGGLVAPKELDFRAFAANLMRRLSLLSAYFCHESLNEDFVGLLRVAESIEIGKPSLRWQELRRYSSRQRTELKMGGIMGSFTIGTDAIERFWPFLWLGQWTHLGKGTTMGLGRYVLHLNENERCKQGFINPAPL